MPYKTLGSSFVNESGKTDTLEYIYKNSKDKVLP